MAGELESFDQPREDPPGGQQVTEYVGDHPYKLRDGHGGGLVLVKYTTVDGKTVPSGETKLTNFAAFIVADTRKDDGAEVSREYEMTAYIVPGGRRENFTVPADQFPSMNWVSRHLGAGAIVRAGQGQKDHARAAIQYLSTGNGEMPVRRIVELLTERTSPAARARYSIIN